MKIRPRSIPKFQGGNNIWYQGLIDYDPTKYQISYDTSRLVNGDMSDTILSPWKSDISGYDVGRYQPTDHGAFGKGKEHYNYTLGVEGQDYYKKFGEDLLDSNGNFTPIGEAWAKAVDALLPNGSNASFYDPKTEQLRTKWITQYRDAHGRSAQTFTNLRDYVNHVRKDQLLGARHNVFLNKGKRYFYIDNQGQKHWVDPSVVDKYNVSKDPSEQGWEGTTYWDDYELMGLKSPNDPPSQNPQDVVNKLRPQETPDPPEKESFLNKLTQGFNKIAPDLLEGIRLAGSLGTNSRVFRESEKAIIPNLQQTYQTHRQVVGDEATKQAYYRRAAQGQTKAAQPFTADADRQMAYMQEARRVGDELRAQGDLADNQEIRRTSDESNQHEWANTQRATEVANSNITELNKADAAKHQLRAQKYLADWTNIDQYLLGRQAKLDQKRNKDLAYQQQLQLLEDQHEINNDEKLQRLKTEASAAYDVYYKDPTNVANYNNYKTKLKAYQDYQYEVQKRILSRRQFAKSGTKLEYKDKTAKFLYKTSKDIVEHFRKMSKMTDDSRVRTLPKPIKLSSHPRKMQMGGVAPFYIYRPYMSGMEQSMSTQTSSGGASSSKKDNEGKDKLDMIKELFKAIQGQGLPIDVSTVYQDISNVLNKAKAFGEDLSTDDIASMYLNSMLKINNLKYSKDVFDKAKAQATANDALNEYAVTTGGALVLQNAEGEVKLGTYQDYVNSKGKWNPITNDQLLNLRAYSPNMALFKGDELMQIVNNGVGMPKIAAEIKSLASTLGSTEQKIEGISEVENKRIKAGLQILAGTSGTPDGFYKVTQDKKDSSTNIKAALTYIYNMLPTNYKTVLKMHSGSEDNSKALIASMLTSQVSDYYKEDIAPLSGKAAADKNGVNSSSSKGGADNSAGLAFVLGQGPREIVDFNTGTSVAIRALGIRGTIQNHSQENLGQGSTLQDVSKSQFSFLKLGQATFGGSRLNPGAYSHIMLNDSEIMGVDLPYKVDLNGNTVPDFQKCKLIEKADEIISQQNIIDPNKINEVYQSVGLPPKYNQNGELNTQKYMRFAAIQATLDEQALQNKEAVLSDEVQLAGNVERDLYKEAMKKNNKDYSLGNGMWLTGWWKDELYKGTIFIPYDEDVAFAAVSSGRPMKQNLPDNASTVQLMQYAPKSLNYKPQDVTLSQIINN